MRPDERHACPDARTADGVDGGDVSSVSNSIRRQRPGICREKFAHNRDAPTAMRSRPLSQPAAVCVTLPVIAWG